MCVAEEGRVVFPLPPLAARRSKPIGCCQRVIGCEGSSSCTNALHSRETGREGERNAKERESKRSVQCSPCSLHRVPPFLPPLHVRISLITFQRNSSSWLSDQTKLRGIVDKPKRKKEIRRKGGPSSGWHRSLVYPVFRSVRGLSSSLSPSYFWNSQAVSSCLLTGHACVNKALCSYRLGIKPAVGHWRCSTLRSAAWLDQQVWHETAPLKGILISPAKKKCQTVMCVLDWWERVQHWNRWDSLENKRTRKHVWVCGLLWNCFHPAVPPAPSTFRKPHVHVAVFMFLSPVRWIMGSSFCFFWCRLSGRNVNYRITVMSDWKHSVFPLGLQEIIMLTLCSFFYGIICFGCNG